MVTGTAREAGEGNDDMPPVWVAAIVSTSDHSWKTSLSRSDVLRTMLNLQRLRILSELERLGTLAEVAATMAYSPSAISQQLSQLEQEAGVPLLERAGRTVRLTDAARGLVVHAGVILERMERAESELAAARPQVSGVLRVASFQSPLVALAPPTLTLLADRHPQLQVHLVQRELQPALAGLLAHDFDVILGEEYPGLAEPAHARVDRVDLLPDPILLALPLHGPWSQPHRLVDLADAPWALDPADSSTGQWARTALRTAGVEPRIPFDTPDPLLQVHLVRSGHAVAFVPALLGGDRLAGTRVVAPAGRPCRLLYTAVRSGRTAHPAIQAFRRALRDTATAVETDATATVLA